jgi:Fur family ferric uptake transcriptional regulator
VTQAGKHIAEKKNIEALCAAKGMRMTEQRRVIARVLAPFRRCRDHRAARFP